MNGRYNDKELSELFEQIWKKRTDLETNDDVQKEEDDALKQLTHLSSNGVGVKVFRTEKRRHSFS